MQTYNIILMEIEKEIATVSEYIADASDARDGFNALAVIHTKDGAHRDIENKVYIAAANHLCETLSTESLMIYTDLGLPVSLNDVNLEGFRGKLEEIGHAVWRTIAASAEALRKLVLRWYTHVIDLLKTSSSDANIWEKKLQDSIDKSDRIAEDYGLLRGEKVPLETLNAIADEFGQGALTFIKDGILVTREDWERDITNILDPKKIAQAAAIIGVNGDVSHIEASFKDTSEILSNLNFSEHVSEVTEYYNQLVSIVTNDDLNALLNDSSHLPAKAFDLYIKGTGLIAAGKDKFVSKPVIGGSSLAVTRMKIGNSVYPTVRMFKPSKARAKPVSMTLAESLIPNRNLTEMADGLEKAGKVNKELLEVLVKLVGPNGSGLKEVSDNINRVTYDHGTEASKVLLREMQGIGNVMKGWANHFSQVAKLSRDVNESIESFSNIVMAEYKHVFSGNVTKIGSKNK